MPVHSFIHSLGSVGLFPSRAFLPAFVAALLLRFGDSMPLVAHAELAGNVHAPSWFISNTSLLVLGILSCLECWATKNADVRELLHQFDGAVKTVMTLLTSFGVASVDHGEVVRAIQQAGIADGIFGLMAAGTVFFLTSARQSLYELLTEIDADDSLGIQKLASWAEDAWVVFGAAMLIVFPLLMILLTAVVFGLLYVWQKAAHAREEQLRVRCASCGHPIYRCAIACPACGAANRQACAVNWLGLPKLDQPADPADHALRLLAVRRCPSCATRLKQKRPRQTCDGCRREVFSDDAQLAAYLQLVHARFMPTLLACFLLGLVPVIGVVPAIVYYRIHLVSPFRRYVPFGSALLAKWLGRFACFAVLSIQWIPFLGIASLPIMAAINYVVYRRALQNAWPSRQRQPSVPLSSLFMKAMDDLEAAVSKWYESRRDVPAEAARKADEADEMAENAITEAEAREYRAVAQVWREIAEDFRRENEELKAELKKALAAAKSDLAQELNDLKIENIIEQSEDGSLRLLGSGRRLALPAPRIGSQNGDARGQDGDVRAD